MTNNEMLKATSGRDIDDAVAVSDSAAFVVHPEFHAWRISYQSDRHACVSAHAEMLRLKKENATLKIEVQNKPASGCVGVTPNRGADT